MMCCLVHPGNLKNLRSDIKLLKEKGIYNKVNSNKTLLREHFKDTQPSLEMKHLMKYRFRDIPNINQDN